MLTGWVKAVANLGSIWTVDHVIVDAPRLEAVIEWTHFKPKQGIYLRGDEWYVFSKAGLIREIRAYYACPTATDPRRSHEIGDFDYRWTGLSAGTAVRDRRADEDHRAPRHSCCESPSARQIADSMQSVQHLEFVGLTISTDEGITGTGLHDHRRARRQCDP